jgi:Aldose 1-epimerase
MQHVLYPQPGYPFSFRTSVEYALSDCGLLVRTTTTNLGSERCPYGRGAHPYLTLGTTTIDRLLLTLPAGTVLQSDQRGLPVVSKDVEGTGHDFRQSRRSVLLCWTMHSLIFNETRTDFARVELQDPDSEIRASLWVDQTYPYLMLFRGDLLPQREPSQSCRRADDSPAKCISNWGFFDRVGARLLRHGDMGHYRRTGHRFPLHKLTLPRAWVIQANAPLVLLSIGRTSAACRAPRIYQVPKATQACLTGANSRH